LAVLTSSLTTAPIVPAYEDPIDGARPSGICSASVPKIGPSAPKSNMAHSDPPVFSRMNGSPSVDPFTGHLTRKALNVAL
jgi:hypothetical protein